MIDIETWLRGNEFVTEAMDERSPQKKSKRHKNSESPYLLK